jgi:hypothetical protein
VRREPGVAKEFVQILGLPVMQQWFIGVRVVAQTHWETDIGIRGLFKPVDESDSNNLKK